MKERERERERGGGEREKMKRGEERRLCSVVFQEGCGRGSARRSQIAGGYTSPTLAARTRIRVARCRCWWWRRRRGGTGAGTGGGVTVGYASHSCRGRRTETNRLCMPRRVARFLATVRPALPFPFPSRLSFSFSLSLSLSLSFSLSFPFLFVFSSLVPADDYGHGHRELRVLATEKQHFLVPLLPHFPGRSPCDDSGTLPSVSVPRCEIKVLRYA